MHEDGLMVGDKLPIIRLLKGRLAVAEDGERCLTLLSILRRKAVEADVLLHLEAAAAYLRHGNKALANLRLAFAHLPPIADEQDMERLLWAAFLLDRGVAPRQLMQHLALDSSAFDAVTKYSRDQPRVPAGNGRTSGQFGSYAGYQALLSVPGAANGFLAGASQDIVAALTRFASRLSIPTAVLGALFIPTPNSGGVTEGSLPDAPDVAFKNDAPAGVLTLSTVAGGQEVAVTARNQSGVFVATQSGQEIGRDLGGHLFLALDAVMDVLEDAQEAHEDEGTKPKAAINNDEPRLCPAPQKDTPHGSKETAAAYEDDVHRRVNPLAPIPSEFAVKFVNPITGLTYYFDDCFRYSGDLVDGDMKLGDLVDAKGPRYAFLLTMNDRTQQGVTNYFRETANKQLAVVAGTERRIKWYMAEKSAADYARRLFEDEKLDITVSHMPPRHVPR